MKVKAFKLCLFVSVLSLAIAIFALIQYPMQDQISFGIMSPGGQIKLSTELPEGPGKLPKYRVVGDESVETITNESPQYGKVRYNLPSEEEAVEFAMEALEEHGGVPEDAKLSNVRTDYEQAIVFDDNTAKVVDKSPLKIRVSFERYLNGLPVAGPGGAITVLIGDDGELIDLIKTWRKLEYVEDVEIISAEEAYEKLKRGEMENKPPMGPTNLKIVEVSPGYYAKSSNEPQDYYNPVWLFHCKDEHNNNVTRAVNALK